MFLWIYLHMYYISSDLFILQNQRVLDYSSMLELLISFNVVSKLNYYKLLLDIKKKIEAIIFLVYMYHSIIMYLVFLTI